MNFPLKFLKSFPKFSDFKKIKEQIFFFELMQRFWFALTLLYFPYHVESIIFKDELAYRSNIYKIAGLTSTSIHAERHSMPFKGRIHGSHNSLESARNLRLKGGGFDVWPMVMQQVWVLYARMKSLKFEELAPIGGILCVALNGHIIDGKNETVLWSKTTSNNLKNTFSIFLGQVFVTVVALCLTSLVLIVPFSPVYLLFMMPLQMLIEQVMVA
jgi:hypothetical protein